MKGYFHQDLITGQIQVPELDPSEYLDHVEHIEIWGKALYVVRILNLCCKHVFIWNPQLSGEDDFVSHPECCRAAMLWNSKSRAFILRLLSGSHNARSNHGYLLGCHVRGRDQKRYYDSMVIALDSIGRAFGNLQRLRAVTTSFTPISQIQYLLASVASEVRVGIGSLYRLHTDPARYPICSLSRIVHGIPCLGNVFVCRIRGCSISTRQWR